MGGLSSLANNLLVPGLVAGSIYSLVGIGFCVVERTTRVLNFAHGALIMWCPMAALVADRNWHWPAAASIALGVAAALVFGLASERLVIRPFIGRHQQLGWLLAGLGVTVILQQLAFQPFLGQPQQFPIALSSRPITVGGAQLTAQYLLAAGALVVVSVLVLAFYRYLRSGRELVAVGEDMDGARVVGISVGRASILASMIAALIAAVTGLVAAPIQLVSPQLGLNLTFVGFVALALGGMGQVAGAIVGGLAVGLIEQAAAVYLAQNLQNTALFTILVLVYLVKPSGLLGRAAVREI